MRDGGVGKWGASDVGVQDYPGGVDNASERRSEGGLDFINDSDNDFGDDFGDDASFQLSLLECFRIWNSGGRWLVFQTRAELGEDLTDGLGDEGAAGYFGQGD